MSSAVLVDMRSKKSMPSGFIGGGADGREVKASMILASPPIRVLSAEICPCNAPGELGMDELKLVLVLWCADPGLVAVAEPDAPAPAATWWFVSPAVEATRGIVKAWP